MASRRPRVQRRRSARLARKPLGVRRRSSKRSSGQPRPMGIMADPRVRAWDQLLRDPCSANLTAPCYSGLDSGYLIRTTDLFVPGCNGAALTVGPATGDFVFQFTPFNWSASTGQVGCGIAPANTVLPVSIATGFNDFITGATVARYRPVAACVKWLPSGPYSTRQGTVSTGITTGMTLLPGATPTLTGARSICQRFAPNGGEAHEVRWLPTAVDENFTTFASTNSGAGSIIVALQGVDGNNVSATSFTSNGTMEITVVWEWTPALTGTSGGITVAPKAPLPFSTQQVLATISDLGAYIFEGVRTNAGGTQGLVNAAVTMGSSLLSGGVRARGYRGPSINM